MASNDYYRVLGVEPNADAGTIREAYRRLALQYHPDRNADSAESSEKMKAVNEAYAVLSDADKRREYDSLRSRYGSDGHTRFRQSFSEQDIFRGSDIEQVFEEVARAFGVRGFDDMFRQFYGPTYRRFDFHRPGFKARGFFVAGGLRFGRGAGRRKGPRLGRLSRLFLEKIGRAAIPQDGADLHDVLTLSEQQAAQGGPFAYEYCPRRQKLVVKIPAGVREDQKIRLAGMGAAGRNGGRPGNLLLKVRIKKPFLRRITDLAGNLTRR